MYDIAGTHSKKPNETLRALKFTSHYVLQGRVSSRMFPHTSLSFPGESPAKSDPSGANYHLAKIHMCLCKKLLSVHIAS